MKIVAVLVRALSGLLALAGAAAVVYGVTSLISVSDAGPEDDLAGIGLIVGVVLCGWGLGQLTLSAAAALVPRGPAAAVLALAGAMWSLVAGLLVLWAILGNGTDPLFVLVLLPGLVVAAGAVMVLVRPTGSVA